MVLRVARFFPEADDDEEQRSLYSDANAQANEFLYRRLDLEDAVEAHVRALSRARPSASPNTSSAPPPRSPAMTWPLWPTTPRGVVRRLFPDQEAEYARRGWTMFPRIDRVYVNARARTELEWTPRHDFRTLLDRLKADQDPRSPLARAVGAKGYHRPARG